MQFIDSHSNDGDKNHSDASGDTTQQVDTTDYSACSRGTPTHDIRGAWKQSLENNGFTSEMTIEVSDDFTRLTNNCSLHGRDLTAAATAPTTFDNLTFSILGNGQDEKAINEDNFNMKCRVDFKPMQMRYTFKGSCLVLEDPQSQKTMTLIPAR